VFPLVQSPSYRFLDAMPSASTLNDAPSCVDWSSTASLSPPTNEGFSVPTQVNYVIKGGQLWKQGEKIPGSAMVVNNYLRNGYLWDTVRVIGGAYGGFSSFSRYSGIFSFGSYRDPNLAGTLAAYDKAGEHLLEAELNKAELQQAIIGSIGDLDGPMSPDQKGFTSLVEFISGETPEERQAWRDEVLSTSTEDFQEFGKRLIELRGRATTAVVGSKKALTEANETLPDKEKLSVVELL
jgi:Zn-dependent M16 (insulinase) family peptidase